MAISVVLVEDHQVVREGVRALLEAQPDLAVIGEAASGLGVTDLVERLTPDILILDLMLPGLSGLEVARQVSHRVPTTRILILSMHANEAYVLQALSSGASGYILKDSSAQDLVRAIHEVMEGHRFLSPPLSERAIEAYMQKAQDALLDPYDALTSREREVLHLAAEGRTNAEIATELSISPRTAEVHRANLMRKLNLRNQTELIRYALRRGILPMDT